MLIDLGTKSAFRTYNRRPGVPRKLPLIGERQYHNGVTTLKHSGDVTSSRLNTNVPGKCR